MATPSDLVCKPRVFESLLTCMCINTQHVKSCELAKEQDRIGTGNQMAALRFQTERRHKTYNNNRLLMVPHLVRAQGAYKDIRIYSFHHAHTHTHTHSLSLTPTHSHTLSLTHTHTHAHTHTTNTCITGDGLVQRADRK